MSGIQMMALATGFRSNDIEYFSVDFNTVEKLVTVEDSALDTSKPFTMETWFKLDTGLTDVVFFLGVGDFDPEPLLGRVSGMRAYYNSGRLTSSHSVLADTWYHYALVFENPDYVAYIDGSEVDRATGNTNNVIGVGEKINVGGDNDTLGDNNYVIDGRLYGTRISFAAKYTSAFTPSANYGVEGDTDFLLVSKDGAIYDAAGNYTFNSYDATDISPSNEKPS